MRIRSETRPNGRCSRHAAPDLRAARMAFSRGSRLSANPLCTPIEAVDPLEESYSPDGRLDLAERLVELRGRPPLRPFFLAAFAFASLRTWPMIRGAQSRRLRASATRPVSDASTSISSQ